MTYDRQRPCGLLLLLFGGLALAELACAQSETLGFPPGGTPGAGGDGAGGNPAGAGGVGVSPIGAGGVAGTGAAGVSGAAGRGGTSGLAGRGGTTGLPGRGGTTGTAGRGGTTGADAGAGATFTQVYSTVVMGYCGGASCHFPNGPMGLGMSSKNAAYMVFYDRALPGNGAGSGVFITLDSGAMPRGEPRLSEANLALVKSWIDAGALNN